MNLFPRNKHAYRQAIGSVSRHGSSYSGYFRQGSRLYRNPWSFRAVVFVGYAFLSSLAAQAEVTLDGTLGPSGPLAGPNYMISDDLGQVRGSNLFHSFGDFTINTGESATFTGPNSVENILGRVTGGNASWIDGRLSSQIPGANLFLMNPSGLMFGPNASLDVSGSFHATTADYLGLADGSRFDANAPANNILTTAPPAAFGFLRDNPAPITVDKTTEEISLEVPNGETLSLVAGDIQIRGARQGENLSAPSGQINLISVASPGKAVDETPETLDAFELQSFDSLGSIELSQAEVTTFADPGGTIYIRGGKLSLEESVVSATSTGDIDHPGIGADIVVTGDMTLTSKEDDTFVFTQALGAGNGGDIRIQAGSMQLTGGIVSLTDGSGNAGDIEIQVERLEMSKVARITSAGQASGDGGDITISACEVELSGGEGFAFISAVGGLVTPETGDSGDAGNLTITADTIRLLGSGSGFVGLSTQIGDNARGAPNAGDLRLEVGHLEVQGGAQISAGLLGGSGQGGSIDVNADTILIVGRSADGAPSGIFASAAPPFGEPGAGPTGNSGDILITTGDLEIKDGGEISVFANGLGNSGNLTVQAGNLSISNDAFLASSNFGRGAAGDIEVDARNVRLLGPSTKNQFTGIFAVGGVNSIEAGDVRLSAEDLQILDGAVINSGTAGPGAGGTVEVMADSVLIAGRDLVNDVSSQIDARTFIFSDFVDEATGRGGDVIVNAGILHVTDHGQITAGSSSAGEGGSITLNVNQLSLSDDALITVESTNTGNTGNVQITARDSFRADRSSVTAEAKNADGGNIQLTAGELVYLNESKITSTVAGGEGLGGNITIDPTFVVLNKSDIQANAFEGPGGNILIVADNFIASADSTITASSEFGVQGEIEIRSPESTVVVGTEGLPQSFLDASSLLSERCAARTEGKVGSFVLLGRGGVSSNPDAPLSGFYGIIDKQTESPSARDLSDRGEVRHGLIMTGDGQPLGSGVQSWNRIQPARFDFRCRD